MNHNENKTDFISLLENIENEGENDLKDFSEIAQIEPQPIRYIEPNIFYEEGEQNETNDTTIKAAAINFLNEKHGIEMICPYVGRRRLRKYLRIKRKTLVKRK
jgi:hypothetical protein